MIFPDIYSDKTFRNFAECLPVEWPDVADNSNTAVLSGNYMYLIDQMRTGLNHLKY